MTHDSWFGALVGCEECRRTRRRARKERIDSAKRIYRYWVKR